MWLFLLVLKMCQESGQVRFQWLSVHTYCHYKTIKLPRSSDIAILTLNYIKGKPRLLLKSLGN